MSRAERWARYLIKRDLPLPLDLTIRLLQEGIDVEHLTYSSFNR
jgi:hypothetical protein